MERAIAHIDLDAFYASVECLCNPEIRHLPVAVVGDSENRHGIVLAKNQLAKMDNVKTGDPIFMAKNKCPNIVFVKGDFNKYLRFSKLVKNIYREYTDMVESFGIDEAWLDLTHSQSLYGDAETILEEIRKRVYTELGLTVSIGLSFNKIFAKLGSDQNKPNGFFKVTKDDFKQKIWPLPAKDLLYVGGSTDKKLSKLNVKTIGDLAKYDTNALVSHLGKNGELIQNFARGLDTSPVKKVSDEKFIKTIGNSITTRRDLETIDDVKIVFYMLSESVAKRLREHGLVANGVQIYVRDNSLSSITRQGLLKNSSCLTKEIAEKALEIFIKKHVFNAPIRSLGIRAIDLASVENGYQLDLFTDTKKREKLLTLEKTVDTIQSVYGYNSVKKGILLSDKNLSSKNIKENNVIFPVSYTL